MRIGIMGGTFNPIHLGHLIAAEQARDGMGLQEVWFLPSNIPPHKEPETGAAAEQRLEMVRRAVSGHPQFRVNDLELRLGGKSYSVNTVAELQKQHPDHEFYFIIGGDMVQYLPNWHRIEELVRKVFFIGLQRAGTTLDPDSLPDWIREKVVMIPMPMIQISSTDIRGRFAEKQSIRYLVPDEVRSYIEENGLYES
ncbi:nicotinate-nucleotide adenylyltransferase [Ferviditalea candida]|uniref:Probable nicotinate-nucleotide adenylyltransferase n=1 Tax=Ferviditalea candida TaxID=3108399 RepID=A0ABU5ZE17_9BACL|nr:nicotinate-nucleotide adenylyltransferase [Paenibacillaceae bacterium T2]